MGNWLWAIGVLGLWAIGYGRLAMGYWRWAIGDGRWVIGDGILKSESFYQLN